MATLLHYLPYIVGAAIAVLILVCLSESGRPRKHTEPQRPKQIYYRRNQTPVG